ncbi:MAG TPA: hypothetical protein VKQ72_14670 [Aggregatilineales bacterium]|nr:hypothetical protein [Aggregatilineales bacterium]
MKSNHSSSKFFQYVLYGSLSLPLLIYLAATFFARYVADDFCHFETVNSIGVLNFVAQFYQTWTGSWAFVFGLGISKFLPVWVPAYAVLLVWIVVLIGFTRRWNPIFGLALLVATFATIPDVISTTYIQAGLLKYSAPLVGVCLEAWLLAAFPDTAWAYAAFALTAIIAAALGDIIGIVQIIALICLMINFPKYRNRLGITFIAAIVGFLIVYLAPGTSGRQSAFPRPDLILSILYAARAMGYPVAYAIRQSPLAFITMMLIAVFGTKHKVFTHLDRQRTKLQIVSILTTIIFLNFVCEFTAYYATSGPLADRAELFPIFFTFAGFMWIGHLLGSLMEWKSQSALTISIGMLTVVGVVSAFGTASTMQGLAKAWDTRDHLMRTSGELTHLDVPLDIWDIEHPDVRACIISFYQRTANQ